MFIAKKGDPESKRAANRLQICLDFWEANLENHQNQRYLIVFASALPLPILRPLSV